MFRNAHIIASGLIGGLGIFALPLVAVAASNGFTSLQGFLVAAALFLQNIFLPFLFSLAFIYFLINLARYFVVEGDNEGSHAKARSQAVYGIAAFVFLFALWGIVAMVVSGLQIGGYRPSCPDFISQFGGTCSSQTGGTFSGGSFQ